MSLLNELRATGGSAIIIPVLELQSELLAESLFFCNGFEDIEFKLENNEYITAVATGLDIALPKKDASGSQKLRFAIANAREIAVDLVDQAMTQQKRINLIYREYLSTKRSAPASNPLKMICHSVTIAGDTVEVIAGFFDLIDTQFPRDVYNSTFAPGLKYAN